MFIGVLWAVESEIRNNRETVFIITASYSK